MENRREFLKLLGIGATVSVVGVCGLMPDRSNKKSLGGSPDADLVSYEECTITPKYFGVPNKFNVPEMKYTRVGDTIYLSASEPVIIDMLDPKNNTFVDKWQKALPFRT